VLSGFGVGEEFAVGVLAVPLHLTSEVPPVDHDSISFSKSGELIPTTGSGLAHDREGADLTACEACNTGS
jgi:hypothetical protein